MEFKPLSGRELPRFSGIKTFFRLPVVDLSEEFDVALVGVPYDGGVSYRPGCRFAPSKIRESSSLGRGFHWSRGMALFDRLRVADVGDCPIVPIDQKQSYQKIEDYFSHLLREGKRFIAIGGDHSITLPLLRSMSRRVGKKMALIHFDAHLDTYPAAWNCEYHHGAFVRHAIEEGLVDPKQSLHIGIRGPLAAESDLDFVHKHKMNIVTVDDIRRKDLESFLATLPVFDQLPTYISFDIDCLDPVFAPGTGTPVVGGLTTYEIQRILRSLKI
ncbi:MAG: agmatinase, partial [Bdellovibrionales bacterium]|nr:agmatinase [Bdellovibrionales bacterium]